MSTWVLIHGQISGDVCDGEMTVTGATDGHISSDVRDPCWSAAIVIDYDIAANSREVYLSVPLDNRYVHVSLDIDQ